MFITGDRGPECCITAERGIIYTLMRVGVVGVGGVGGVGFAGLRTVISALIG